SIIKNQAEALKTNFGSALASENRDEEIVSIPGLKGREPKEISLKNLANIIQARTEEIVEHVYYEIRNSGFENKLIAGIVLTGGGSQLKHIAQLTSFITGMDTRIGYPSEHLAKAPSDEVSKPMHATGVGLVIQGFKNSETQRRRKEPRVSTHSQKSKGNFFDVILKKGKQFFENDSTD
ncbi:MAG: cell division FtsA domain-containing protein, partial [Bacteroidota bacterium]